MGLNEIKPPFSIIFYLILPHSLLLYTILDLVFLGPIFGIKSLVLCSNIKCAKMFSIFNKCISANLSILDAKNYDKWCKHIKVLFGYQDYDKKEKTNDIKALYMIH